MQLDLPKWMSDEIESDSHKSVQYVIKEIIKEYLESKEGKRIRDRIREREGVLN
jgi:hypothetical protein